MGKKILVVDDAFDDGQTMRILLERNGYQVKAVTDGAQALDAINKAKFDLVLVDILMPILSGYDLLILMKERLEEDTKVVYVSIVPKTEVNMKGTDGFIQKPFSPESFISVVKPILEKQ